MSFVNNNYIDDIKDIYKARKNYEHNIKDKFWCLDKSRKAQDKTCDKCLYQFERNVNETLWYSIMKWNNNNCGDTYGDNPDHTFENEVFTVKSYDWNEEDNNEWHFWHKPSGFKLQWYKYPLRIPFVNKNITHEQFYAILHDCMNSVHSNFTVAINKWWEENLYNVD